MNHNIPTYAARYTRQDMDALYGTRPATSASQAVQCPDGYIPYTLQSGDTLYAIAMTHGVTVTELLFYNPGLNPYGYRAGEIICVPAEAQGPNAQQPAEPGEGTVPLPTPSLPSGSGTPAQPGEGSAPLPTPSLPSGSGTPAQPGEGSAPLPTPSVPSQPSAPQIPVCENGTLYTVRSGDTLRSIARRFGITLSALMAANPGNTNTRIFVGQKLCIPMATCGMCCPENTTQARATAGGFVDLLITYNISYAALADANPSVDLDALKEGQTVCIPPAGSRGTCTAGVGTLELPQDITAAELAQQLRITVEQLMRANPTYRPTDFLSGRIICVPAAQD